jgi:putative membrane protein
MPQINMNFSNENPPITSSRFWIKVLIMTAAIFITCYLFSIAQINSIKDALFAAVIISLLNAFIKPILVFISIPLMVFTFGLFNLVINALIILFTSSILKGFEVNGFWDAVLFSIIITFLSYLIDIPIKIQMAKKKAKEQYEKNNHKDYDDTEYTDYEDLSSKDN